MLTSASLWNRWKWSSDRPNLISFEDVTKFTVSCTVEKNGIPTVYPLLLIFDMTQVERWFKFIHSRRNPHFINVAFIPIPHNTWTFMIFLQHNFECIIYPVYQHSGWENKVFIIWVFVSKVSRSIGLIIIHFQIWLCWPFSTLWNVNKIVSIGLVSTIVGASRTFGHTKSSQTQTMT